MVSARKEVHLKYISLQHMCGQKLAFLCTDNKLSKRKKKIPKILSKTENERLRLILDW